MKLKRNRITRTVRRISMKLTAEDEENIYKSKILLGGVTTTKLMKKGPEVVVVLSEYLKDDRYRELVEELIKKLGIKYKE